MTSVGRTAATAAARRETRCQVSGRRGGGGAPWTRRAWAGRSPTCGAGLVPVVLVVLVVPVPVRRASSRLDGRGGRPTDGAAPRDAGRPATERTPVLGGSAFASERPVPVCRDPAREAPPAGAPVAERDAERAPAELPVPPSVRRAAAGGAPGLRAPEPRDGAPRELATGELATGELAPRGLTPRGLTPWGAAAAGAAGSPCPRSGSVPRSARPLTGPARPSTRPPRAVGRSRRSMLGDRARVPLPGTGSTPAADWRAPGAVRGTLRRWPRAAAEVTGAAAWARRGRSFWGTVSSSRGG